MTRREKEIQQAYINNEKQVLSDIKKAYTDALKSIDEKISELMGREDLENLKSIIYQANYQKALKSQINTALDKLNANQFETISDYLKNCYEDGYIGTMYDLHGQGIPLILPIDPKQVVKAVTLDSKISKGLYTKLGYDVGQLKKTISAEVSRGIATAMPYADIARNIKNQSGVAMNKAFRISRTEGHRITQQSTLDAQVKAKEKGADVVKQWASSTDKRTRKHHKQLNGQVREIEDYFEVSGRKVLAPGQFGAASEDINCRCFLKQRAKWALNDGGIERLKQNRDIEVIDSKNYSDFKKYYQNKAMKKGGE